VNSLFNITRHNMATGAFNWVGGPGFVLQAWHGDWTFDPAVLTPAAITAALQATSLPLTNRGVASLGYCASDPALFSALAVGPEISFLTMSYDNGSRDLVAFFDEGFNMPFTPNGNDWLIQPDYLSQRGWFRP